jgi:hypothetical protein
MRPLADLPPEWQAKIAELVATAPPLSSRQKERLELLFRGGDDASEDAAVTEPAREVSQ